MLNIEKLRGLRLSQFNSKQTWMSRDTHPSNAIYNSPDHRPGPGRAYSSTDCPLKPREHLTAAVGASPNQV